MMNSNRVVETARRRYAPMVWFGGKARHCLRIHEYLALAPPNADTYVEPYAGALSVYWTLPRAYPREILNDIDRSLIAMYRVLQNREAFLALWSRLTRTPYAATTIDIANEALENANAHPLDIAWSVIVLYNSGFGGMRPTTKGSWGRNFVTTHGISATVNGYLHKLHILPALHRRLQAAELHCTDALDIIRAYDSPATVFYLDPPYHPDTRKSGEYTHEVDARHHWELLETLTRLKGFAVLSGYPHEDYQALETVGWQRVVFTTSCHAAVRGRNTKLRGVGSATAHAPRWECLWYKPVAP